MGSFFGGVVELMLGILLSLLIVGSSLNQNVVLEEIEVTGNSVLRAERILREFGLARGDSLADELVERGVKRVLDVYKDSGYWRAKVEVLPSERGEGRISLKLNIEEGEPVLIKEIAVEGNSLFAQEEILSRFNTKVGRQFCESVFQGDVDDLLRRYANRGYPFSKVSPKDFWVDSLGLRFSLEVDEGPLVVIEELEVEGNTITKPWVILREMGLRQGDVYSEERLESGKRRVARLPFLAGEPETELRPATDIERATVVVKVREGTMNSVSGALGWIPKGEGDGELTGLVDLSLANLFGTGRRIEATWRRTSSLSSSLGFAYLEPWFLGAHVSLSLRFSHAIRDTSYAETDVALVAELPLGDVISGQASLGVDRVIPGDLALPKSTKYKASLGAAVDTRDNRKNPLRGVLYEFSTEYGYKRNYATPLFPDPEPRARVVKVRFDFRNFLQVFPRQVLYLSLNGGEVRSNESPVPLSEHFRFGGARTVRGYYEEEFSGERVGWANLEYRFLIGRNSRIAPLLDAGYFQHQRETGELARRTMFGYGLGLRVGSARGVFFLDYGLGEGDGPLEGKVHFGAETEF